VTNKIQHTHKLGHHQKKKTADTLKMFSNNLSSFQVTFLANPLVLTTILCFSMMHFLGRRYPSWLPAFISKINFILDGILLLIVLSVSGIIGAALTMVLLKVLEQLYREGKAVARGFK
jgi:hypothetical protein